MTTYYLNLSTALNIKNTNEISIYIQDNNDLSATLETNAPTLKFDNCISTTDIHVKNHIYEGIEPTQDAYAGESFRTLGHTISTYLKAYSTGVSDAIYTNIFSFDNYKKLVGNSVKVFHRDTLSANVKEIMKTGLAVSTVNTDTYTNANLVRQFSDNYSTLSVAGDTLDNDPTSVNVSNYDSVLTPDLPESKITELISDGYLKIYKSFDAFKNKTPLDLDKLPNKFVGSNEIVIEVLDNFETEGDSYVDPLTQIRYTNTGKFSSLVIVNIAKITLKNITVDGSDKQIYVTATVGSEIELLFQYIEHFILQRRDERKKILNNNTTTDPYAITSLPSEAVNTTGFKIVNDSNNGVYAVKMGDANNDDDFNDDEIITILELKGPIVDIPNEQSSFGITEINLTDNNNNNTSKIDLYKTATTTFRDESKIVDNYELLNTKFTIYDTARSNTTTSIIGTNISTSSDETLNLSFTRAPAIISFAVSLGITDMTKYQLLRHTSLQDQQVYKTTTDLNFQNLGSEKLKDITLKLATNIDDAGYNGGTQFSVSSTIQLSLDALKAEYDKTYPETEDNTITIKQRILDLENNVNSVFNTQYKQQMINNGGADALGFINRNISTSGLPEDINLYNYRYNNVTLYALGKNDNNNLFGNTNVGNATKAPIDSRLSVLATDYYISVNSTDNEINNLSDEIFARITDLNNRIESIKTEVNNRYEEQSRLYYSTTNKKDCLNYLRDIFLNTFGISNQDFVTILNTPVPGDGIATDENGDVIASELPNGAPEFPLYDENSTESYANKNVIRASDINNADAVMHLGFSDAITALPENDIIRHNYTDNLGNKPDFATTTSDISSHTRPVTSISGKNRSNPDEDTTVNVIKRFHVLDVTG